MTSRRRSAEKIVDDLIDACSYAAEIVARGKRQWDADVVVRLAGEAVAGRLGDGAGKLPPWLRDEIADVQWDEIIRMRVIVHHVYHRIRYEELWSSLGRDAPALMASLTGWRDGRQAGR